MSTVEDLDLDAAFALVVAGLEDNATVCCLSYYVVDLCVPDAVVAAMTWNEYGALLRRVEAFLAAKIVAEMAS